jgi:voltage-gated potassium channel
MSNKAASRINFGIAWKRLSSLPLASLALVYLAAYSLEVTGAGNAIGDIAALISLGIWFAFAIDLFIRLVTASSLGSFFKMNWFEIVTLALPFIRVLRVFRSVIALRGLKGFTRDRLHATGIYIAFLLPFVWYSGAIAVLDAESSNPEASISNLGEALWWSLTTITTVGYGDKYPTTIEGQLVAAALMLTGIALFSAAAGMFASWITKGNSDKNSSDS